MALDKALVLTATRREFRKNDVTTARRARLFSRISRQIELVNAEISGQPSTRADRRLTHWWWQDDGKWYVQIQYCRQPLELAKGKFSIQCIDLDGVISAFNAVQKEIEAGSYDEALKRQSEVTRAKFKSKKQ